jgi:hypothetical protein
MAARRLTLLLAVAAAALFAVASGARASKSAQFDLFRLGSGSLAQQAFHDRYRLSTIAARLRLTSGRARRRTRETAAGSDAAAAFAMPLGSGAYTGIGQYFVRFRVGTPAQPFLLVADTGSDLTWVKCSNSSSAAADKEGRAFRPERSRTWAPISCASDTCVKSLPFSLATCPTPGTACAYDYRSVRHPLPPPFPNSLLLVLAISGAAAVLNPCSLVYLAMAESIWAGRR